MRERTADMNEKEDKREKKRKLSSQVLRERRGGVPKELLERNRENARIRRKLTEVLKDGPKTVPEVAKAAEIPTEIVLWHLMSMKKYGEVIEGEERDSYIAYMLKPQKEEKP